MRYCFRLLFAISGLRVSGLTTYHFATGGAVSNLNRKIQGTKMIKESDQGRIGPLQGACGSLLKSRMTSPGQLEQCSQAASPARLWVGLGRPGLLHEAAGQDCGPQSGFRGSSDRAWPDCRYLQAFE